MQTQVPLSRSVDRVFDSQFACCVKADEEKNIERAEKEQVSMLNSMIIHVIDAEPWWRFDRDYAQTCGGVDYHTSIRRRNAEIDMLAYLLRVLSWQEYLQGSRVTVKCVVLVGKIPDTGSPCSRVTIPT